MVPEEKSLHICIFILIQKHSSNFKGVLNNLAYQQGVLYIEFPPHVKHPPL